MSGHLTPEDLPHITNRLARASEEVRSKKEQCRDSSDRLDLTDWKSERPNLSLDFSSSLKFSHEFLPSSTLEHVPHSSQEYVIVEELLKVFIGGDSDFIQTQDYIDKSGKREFVISPSVDKLNSEFVKKCLPLVSNFSIVARFVEDNIRLGAGRVNQALADCMDKMLSDHLVFVESLELKNRTKKLRLHELWYHVQKSFATFKLLSDIALKVSSSRTRGGQTLSLLHEHFQQMISPLSAEVQISSYLTAHSSVPFFESVKQWIFNGIIYDPFNEFMVANCPDEWKNKHYRDGYWEAMYQIKPQFVPTFLEDVQYHILNSGKYLNVIRECVKSDNEMNLAEIEELKYCEDKSYNDVIIRAYKHSSKILLDYMLNEYNLMERITTAKKYYLLQQGNFIVQLLDTCNEELEKDVNDVTPSRLAALVEMAIRLTSMADTYTEHLTSCLKPLDLGTQVKKILLKTHDPNAKSDPDSSTASDQAESLSGYESFMLSMKCEWPVSLVFNPKVQSVYQMLFRHLFYCKYVERLLGNGWIHSQCLRDVSYKDMKQYYPSITLRNRMMLFVQNMEYYMMEEAIEPAWVEFTEVIKNCESIDNLMAHHWNFLEKCTQDCILTNLELLSIFRRILGHCKELGASLSEIKTLKNAYKFPTFPEHIRSLETHFNEDLLVFLAKLTQLAEGDPTGKVLNLFYRQNYNHFYDKMLKETNLETLLDSLKSI